MKGAKSLKLNGEYALGLKNTFNEIFIRESKKFFKPTWEEIHEIEMHGYRVSEMSEKIAMKMGLSKNDIKAAKICGFFHDIGKFYIDPSILNKKEALTHEEFSIVKSHVLYSKEIMLQKGYYEYSDIVLYHHEKEDGSGYFGLKGNEIPYISKIIALADVYDALMNDRSYRKAYEKETVLEILEREKNKYDNDIYNAFFELYG